MPSRSRDRTGLIMLLDLFLVCFFFFIFLFVPCGGPSWLHVSFLLHVKYTVSYRIVSYRIVAGGTECRMGCKLRRVESSSSPTFRRDVVCTTGVVDMIQRMYPPFPTPGFEPNFTGYDYHRKDINWYEIYKAMAQVPKNSTYWVSLSSCC